MSKETIEQTQPETTATSEQQTEQTTETQETQQTAVTREFDARHSFDAQGVLQKGWRDALLPEELRGDKFFECFNDVQGLMKTAGNQAKMIGKKGVIPITENSTEGEVEEYRRSMGIPHIATDYQFTKPEGVEEIVDLSPEAMAPVLAEMHKGNYNEAQVQIGVNIFAAKMKEFQEAAIAQEQKESDEAEMIIRKEKGDNYDSDLHITERLITENTQSWNQEKRDKLTEALNKNPLRPYIFDLLSTVAGNFMEHKAILTTEDTAEHDLEQEKRELMNTDAYQKRDNPDHEMMVRKVQAIFVKIAAPQQRIIDAQNR